MAERVNGVVPLLIVCLCAGAAVLGIAVLSGDESGWAVSATLTATGALPFFGLTGATGVVLCRRRSALALLGALTMVLSVLGFIAVLALAVDNNLFYGDTWRPTLYLLIACLVAAHCSALLADANEGDTSGLQLARAGMALSLFVVALLVIVEIAETGEDIGVRPVAAVAVLYLLSAAVFGLLRFGGERAAAAGPTRAIS